MLANLWNTVLYNPLVNILALLIVFIPGQDLGLAIILMTILVKLALFPLSQKSLISQKKMAEIQPEIQKIQKSDKNKEQKAVETFALYKKYKVNPFSGCLILLIQLPILWALYSLFLKGLTFNPEILYSFVPAPENINTNFLGLIDLGTKSMALAFLAGLTQFIQARLAPAPNTQGQDDPSSFQAQFAKSMQMQVKYVFPFIIGFVAYTFAGSIALYIIVSNIFTIFQQFYINKNKTK